MQTTTRAALGALLIALAAAAHADSWTGRDKQMHLAAGAAIALPVTLATGSTGYGLAAGCGVGVLKEVADTQRAGHTPSVKDTIVTCAGALVGSQLGGLIVVPRRDGVTVAFATTF